MLKVRLSKVVGYADRDPHLMRRAVDEFFGKKIPDPDHEYFEEMSSLFNEWLIFDFKIEASRNWVTEYYLKNPDSLPSDQLAELEQIIKTQIYDLFEIVNFKCGVFINVYGIFSGKKYKIWEKSLSSQAPNQGSFWNRAAQINGRWVFVGSDPSILPMTYTPRMKKILFNEKGDKKFTPQIVLGLLRSDENKKNPIDDLPKNPQELGESRRKIQKRYSLLANRYGFTPTFEEVVNFVFVENYNHNEADFYTDLIKMGIPEKPFFKHYQLFSDIWNYFPHKKLKGKSPVELFRDNEVWLLDFPSKEKTSSGHI